MADEPTGPLEIELFNRRPADTLPLAEVYAQRERERLMQEQFMRIDISPTSEKTAKSADAGAAMEPVPKLRPTLEAPSEAARNRAAAQMQVPLYRKGLDAATKSVLGLSLEDLQKAIETGELPKHVNLNMLAPGNAIVGDVVQEAAHRQAIESGVPPEVAQTIGTGTGFLAGILFPAGGFKKKGEKAVEAARVLRQESRDALQRFLAGDVPAEAVSRLNVQRVGAEESIRNTMTTLNRLNAERLAASRKTVTHAETIAASEAAGMTIEKALKMPDADFVLDKDKGTALRDLFASVSTRLEQLKMRLRGGETAVEGEFIDTFLIATELARKDELVGRGVARALEARKIQSEAGRAPISLAELQQLREKFGEVTGVDAPTLAAMLDQLTAPQKRTLFKMIGQGLSTGQNMVYEAWINALLSGPQTHVANVLSNSLTAAWAPAERFLAANLDFGADRSVFRGEAAAMLYGTVEGFRDGVRAALQAMKTGESQFGAEKVERVGAIGAHAFGLSPEGTVGGAIDFLGALIRLPGRALMTEDAFFKALNYRMELRAYAYRVAKQEGTADVGTRVREIMANPPPAVKARAEQFALVQTFNQDLRELGWVGTAGGGLLTAADALPMGRVVLPFVRTPTNILHFAMERTPILNALSDTLRADIAAGGEARALAFGKVASGLMVAGSVAALAAAGLITGGGPHDPTLKNEKRLTGWQPYSIKIGDEWVAYNRLDPLGAMLGIMADYSEIAGDIPEGRRLEFAAAMGLAVSRNMVSKTYLEGLSNVLEALGDPERGLEKYLQSLARTLVPTGVRQIARTTDPTLRETRALTEVQVMLNEMRAGVPGYAQDLPPRRNLWGDPITLSGGWGYDLISPIYTSPLKHDPVSDEIVRLKVPLRLPQPIMFGGKEPRYLQMEEPRPAQEGVPLTPGEYDRLLILVGKGVGDVGPLKDRLAALMASSAYRETYTDGPDGSRALAIARLVDAYKQAARAQLLVESPGLQDALDAKMRAKAGALTGQPSAPQGQAPTMLTPSLGR